MKTQRTCSAKCPRYLFLLGLALLLAPAAGADDLTIQGDLIVTGEVSAASLETPSLSAQQPSHWGEHRVTLFPTSGVGRIYLGASEWMYVEEGGTVEAFGNWYFQGSVFAPRFESEGPLAFGLHGGSRVDFHVDSFPTPVLSIDPGAGVFYWYGAPMLSFDERMLAGPYWSADGDFSVGGDLWTYGVLHGNASGLTHLPAGNLTGIVPIENLPPEALGGSVDDSNYAKLDEHNTFTSDMTVQGDAHFQQVVWIQPAGDLSMGDFTNGGP